MSLEYPATKLNVSISRKSVIHKCNCKSMVMGEHVLARVLNPYYSICLQPILRLKRPVRLKCVWLTISKHPSCGFDVDLLALDFIHVFIVSQFLIDYPYAL